MHEAAVMSTVFSSVSILITILGIYTQSNLMRNQQSVLIQFKVDGMSGQQRKLQLKTKGIKREIASILEIDDNVIEIEKPKGFIFRVFVFINNAYYKETDYKRLMERAVNDGKLAVMIGKYWNSQNVPTISDLKYSELQSDAQRDSTVNIVMVNAKSKEMATDMVDNGLPAVNPKTVNARSAVEMEAEPEIVYSDDVEGVESIELPPFVPPVIQNPKTEGMGASTGVSTDISIGTAVDLKHDDEVIADEDDVHTPR